MVDTLPDAVDAVDAVARAVDGAPADGAADMTKVPPAELERFYAAQRLLNHRWYYMVGLTDTERIELIMADQMVACGMALRGEAYAVYEAHADWPVDFIRELRDIDPATTTRELEAVECGNRMIAAIPGKDWGDPEEMWQSVMKTWENIVKYEIK